MHKHEAYEAYRAGDLTENEARELFADEWEDVQQLAHVEDILQSQPDPDVDEEALLNAGTE